MICLVIRSDVTPTAVGEVKSIATSARLGVAVRTGAGNDIEAFLLGDVEEFLEVLTGRLEVEDAGRR